MVIGITISAFSQTIYPKKILWENDTCLAITKPQLIIINRSLNDYIHLQESYRFLQMDLAVSDSLTFAWKNIAQKSDSISIMERHRYNEAMQLNTALQNDLRKQKSKSRKLSIGVGVGGTLLGILLGVLLIK